MMGRWPSRASGATGIGTPTKRMATKSKDDKPVKRLNRAVGVGEALHGVLDSALRKRGFATRDLITRWATIAPKPYDRVAVPDQLKWPRGASHEGATLFLRCAESQRLALSHEGPLVAAAVNRYFGYFLVREVAVGEPVQPRFAPPAELRRCRRMPRGGRRGGGRVADPGLRRRSGRWACRCWPETSAASPPARARDRAYALVTCPVPAPV